MKPSSLNSKDHFNIIATTFDQNYLDWATANATQFPVLFNNQDNKISLNISYRQAARFGFTLINFLTQETWSLAGDLIGFEVNVSDGRSCEIFHHFTDGDQLPKEVVRHCVESAQLLSYQALAHSQEESSLPLVSELEFTKAIIDLFSIENEMWASMWNYDSFGFRCEPSSNDYIPVVVRRKVFKNMLRSIICRLSDFKAVDDAVKLMSAPLLFVAINSAKNAFEFFSLSQPCIDNKGYCAHQFYHEHREK